jgi:GTP-binding protein
MATPTTIDMQALPTIVLVGRVNVGKSTLFNRLIEEQKAIISPIAGTTRTNNEGLVYWRGKYTRVIDTGGLTFDETIAFEEDIIRQSQIALEQADVVLFVTDASQGILPQEVELANRLKKTNIPTFLLANKVDRPGKMVADISGHEWLQLGFGEPFDISATNGRNIGDLLDLVYSQLNKGSIRPKLLSKKEERDAATMNIALIGKPNVGKSSLFNQLIGEDRVIVSDRAHTTRESYDTHLSYEHKIGKKTKTQRMKVIDTAGIRRKAQVKGSLERAGIEKSITTIESADIVLFVLDATEPFSHQDKQLGGLLERRGKSVIIVINKWDQIEDHSQTNQTYVKKCVYAAFPHLDFAPILFVSGKTGHNVHKMFPLLMEVWEARHTEIPTRTLEKFLAYISKKHLPARGKGTRHPKILGIRQIGVAPPVFELWIKYRTSLHSSYVHYIENKMREQFNFKGTTIIIRLTKTRRV